MIQRITRAAVLLALLLPARLAAQQKMVVQVGVGHDTISRYIYGHFSEHLGRLIYDGFWTRSGTGQWHLRDDVIDALKNVKVPILRWPGGCFADYYHWRDGIGPADKRRQMVNSSWGGVVEDNSFGTHEYFELVKRLGTEPFVVGNVGSGSPQEMADWWEYMNQPGPSSLAKERAANGHPEPFNVRFFGVGNESWGCGGGMTPEFYADNYKRYSTYVRANGDVRPFFIATGPNAADTAWTARFLQALGPRRGFGPSNLGLDFHYYTRTTNFRPPVTAGAPPAAPGQPAQRAAPSGPQLSRSATNFGEAEWFASLRNAQRIDDLIRQHSAIMDRYDPMKRIWLVVGEWGIWHEVEPGTNPGFLYQQNTIRDAVIAGVHLNIFNSHADRVKMANLAQTVNVLQALVLTEGDKMLLTPTYWVFEMYKGHQGAVLLPLTIDAGTASFGADTIQAVSASASMKDGKILVTLVNMDPNQGRKISTELQGAKVKTVSGRVLTASTMQAHNTFDQPNLVRPVSFMGARLSGGTLSLELPPMSVVALELQ